MRAALQGRPALPKGVIGPILSKWVIGPIPCSIARTRTGVLAAYPLACERR